MCVDADPRFRSRLRGGPDGRSEVGAFTRVTIYEAHGTVEHSAAGALTGCSYPDRARFLAERGSRAMTCR